VGYPGSVWPGIGWDLTERPVNQPRRLEGLKKAGGKEQGRGDGSGVTLPVVLVGGEMLGEGSLGKAGNKGCKRGQELALFGHHAN